MGADMVKENKVSSATLSADTQVVSSSLATTRTSKASKKLTLEEGYQIFAKSTTVSSTDNIASDEALKTFSQSTVTQKTLGTMSAKKIETKVTLNKLQQQPSTTSTERANAYYSINKMGFAPTKADLAAVSNYVAPAQPTPTPVPGGMEIPIDDTVELLPGNNYLLPTKVLDWMRAQASYTPGEFGDFLTWGNLLRRNHILFTNEITARNLTPADGDYYEVGRQLYARVVEDEQLKHYKALATTRKPALLSWIMCLNNIMSITFQTSENVPGEELSCQRTSYTYNVIAPKALGKFADLLRGVAKSAEMLMFLNGDSNHHSNPNENYARELLELHTFNVPAGPTTYGPAEIAFIARLLTGMRSVTVYNAGARGDQMVGLTPQQQQQRFDQVGAYYFDRYSNRTTGPHNFTLGQGSMARTWTYPLYDIADGDQAIDNFLGFVATHPQTALGLCTRIAKWYFGESPPQDIITDLVGAYNRTGGDLKELYNTVVKWVVLRPIHGSKYKSGEELVASIYRLGNLIDPAANVLEDPVARTKLRRMRELVIEMRHLINSAPTVEGFFNTPDRLISPTSMLTRIDMIRDLSVNAIAPTVSDASKWYYDSGVYDYLAFSGSAAKKEIDLLLAPDRNVSGGDLITAVLLSPAVLKR